MRTPPLDQVFQQASQAAQELSDRRGQTPFPASVDVLSALRLLIPGARLTVAVASARNLDRKMPHLWASIVEDHYAIRTQEGELWSLDGLWTEHGWRERAIEELNNSIACKVPTCSLDSIILEVDPSVNVDFTDPRVVEAMDLVRPRYEALLARQHLDTTTVEVGQCAARRF